MVWIITLALALMLTFALMAIIAIMLAAAGASNRYATGYATGCNDPSPFLDDSPQSLDYHDTSSYIGYNSPSPRPGTKLRRDGTLGGPNRSGPNGEDWRRY